jgi:four helix bundle protein
MLIFLLLCCNKILQMNRKMLEDRTKKFHIDVIKLCEILPRNVVCYEIAKQVIRSAGSVGANYRATRRAKSTADFINKVKIVLEEADESHYWLEILKDADLKKGPDIERLIIEANELTAIFTATDRTTRLNKNKLKPI